MRRPMLYLTAVLLTLLVVFIASAQDGEEPASDDTGAALPITADVRYQVGVGDTLDSIAALFDVSLECIVDTNDIERPATIFPGDILIIRVACPPYAGLDFVAFPRPVADGVGGGANAYVVRAGDSIDRVAFGLDVSPTALLEFNDLSEGDTLFPGQILQIPPDAPPYDELPPFENIIIDPEQGGFAEDFNPEDGIVYTVQPGDTLDTIGAFYNADPACIANVNSIFRPQLLQPRTVIFIPEACAPYPGVTSMRGQILPFDSMTATPLPTVVFGEQDPTDLPEPTATATFPQPDAPQETAIVVPTITPTQEVLEGAEVEVTATFTPAQVNTNTPTVGVTLIAATATSGATETEAATATETPAQDATATETPAQAATATATVAATPTPEVIGDVDVTEEAGGEGNLIDTLGELDVDSTGSGN